MNGNRMKYSSTPTYGMQKRSPLGKKPLFQPKSVMGPDFARATQQSTAAPAADLFTAPVQQPAAPVQPVNPMQAGSIPYAAAPYQQPFAGGYPMGGMTPGAIPGANPWMTAFPVMPQQGSGNLPPLGNTVNPLQSSGFGVRSQGFVPPQTAAAPNVQPAAPGPMGYAPQTPLQPMNPMTNVGYMQSGVPFLNQGSMNYAPVNPAMMQQSAAPQAGSMPGTPQNLSLIHI